MIWAQRHRNATTGLYASTIRHQLRARAVTSAVAMPNFVSSARVAAANRAQAAASGGRSTAGASSRRGGK